MRYTLAQKTFLQSRRPCFVADLFTFSLLSGTVYRWSTSDQPVHFGGQTWDSYGPQIQRKGLSVRNTVEVPELQLSLTTKASDIIGGRDLKEQIINGLFDGATVEFDRIFMPSPGDTSLGLILMFLGRQSTAQVSAAGIQLTAKGDNVLMNQFAPKNVTQANCIHTFCDSGCTLSQNTFSITTTVGPSPTLGLIPWSSIPGDPSIYQLGKITFLSGPSNGQTRSIKQSTNLGIIPSYPLDYLPLAGDSIKVLQGCDLTQPTCLNKFSNMQHFRGFPYIPRAEIAV